MIRDRPKLKDLLVRHRPKRQGKRNDLVYNVNEVETPKKAVGNSRIYIEERLQRESPDVWKSYLAGEIKSARQAGIKAGFIKDTHDPLMRLKANWNKATKKQRREFLKWVESEGE